MRIAVLADIHGNLPALDAVLDDAARAGAFFYLISGDLFSRAPYPRETFERITALPAQLISGNADHYQLEYAANPDSALATAPQWGVVRWTHAQLGPGGLAFLGSLPSERTVCLGDLPPIRMVHGRPGFSHLGMIPDEDKTAREAFRRSKLWPEDGEPTPMRELVSRVAEPLLICAHTHIPFREQSNGKLVINPGAVGLPINGNWRAHYALLDHSPSGWRVEHRALPYDREKLRQAYESSGLLEAGGDFVRACMLNALTGENVPWFFVQCALAYQKSGIDPAQSWILAGQQFDWSQYDYGSSSEWQEV